MSTATSPTVGVIGGGQLARMMYAPATALGIELRLLAETPGTGAARVFADVTVGDYADASTLAGFAAGCDVITFDHEHVPTRLLGELATAGRCFRPGPQALQYAQDKLLMRQRLTRELAVPAPAWRYCPDAAALRGFGDEQGWPIIAKASRGGYDGHGVWKLTGPEQAELPFLAHRPESAGEPVRIIAEEYVDFVRELSIIVVRAPSGQMVTYPVSQTNQRDGVCRETITPAPGLSADQAARITDLGLGIAAALKVTGVLAVEFMQRRTGEAVVNELAMRPHNTGHWTIDGARTSQFENHLRAVLGLPLGDPGMSVACCAMVNIFGGRATDLTSGLVPCFAQDPGLRVELYGKQVRPGRKVGHVNCLGADPDEVLARARRAAHQLMGVAGKK